MNALETRIPPPLAGLLMGVVAWLASSAFAPTTLPFLVRLGSAIAFVVLGLALAGAGARTVSRAKTTLNPIRPDTSTALATSGIYAYTRNPIYLGNTLLLIGFAIALRWGWLAIAAPITVLAVTMLAIQREEKHLAARFADAWRAYAARVRRWI